MDVFGEKSCSVCLKDGSEDGVFCVSVIMPCLHTMCSSCMSELIVRDIHKCHICRGEIEGVIDTVVEDEEEDDVVIYDTLIVQHGPHGVQTIDLTIN